MNRESFQKVVKILDFQNLSSWIKKYKPVLNWILPVVAYVV